MVKTMAQIRLETKEDWDDAREEARLSVHHYVEERRAWGTTGDPIDPDSDFARSVNIRDELSMHDFYGEVVMGEGYDAEATAHLDPFHFNLAVYTDGSVLTWNSFVLNGNVEGPDEGWEAEYEARVAVEGDRFSLSRCPAFDDAEHVATWTGTRWELTTE